MNANADLKFRWKSSGHQAFLFSDKIPIFQGNYYFLAILPLILVFYSLFITIISCENIP